MRLLSNVIANRYWILTFRFRIVITEFICWYRCYGTITKVDKLEDMHRLVLLFLWLSQRFPTLFIDKDSAMEVKALVEKELIKN